MNKKNWIILGAVVVLAGGLLLASRFMHQTSGSGVSEVLISVDGREYARVPLTDPQTVTVTQEDGSENVVVVTAEGAYMASSTCKNQQCIHMGEVTLDNWETRPNQEYIICLPNRVSVQLLPAAQEGGA